MRRVANVKASRKSVCAAVLTDSNSNAEKRREAYRKQTSEHAANDAVTMPELNLDETVRIRETFTEFINGEYVTNTFDLRSVLSELGVYPSEEEMSFVMGVFEGKMSFTSLCQYMRFYKREFQESKQQLSRSSAVQDEREDTLRAFVSLGGNEDGTGSVFVEDLRQVCRNFGLTIDINEALNCYNDSEGPVTLCYAEFCDLWKQQRIENCEVSMSLRGIPFGDALLDVDVNNNSQRNPPRGPRRGKFRLSSPTGEQNPSPSSPYHGKENTDTSYPLPKSVEKHLQDLKHFLTPSAPGEIDDHEAFVAGGACEDANHLLNVPTQFQQNTENDERQRPLRVGPTASLAIPQVSMGEEKAQSPSQQPGGFRAPSPMILSLRNLAAYRQRLQAFARKKEKFNSRGQDKGASGTAALYDDDGSRS